MMVLPPKPHCDADVPPEGIEPARLIRSKDCWKAAHGAVHKRLGGLQRAVRQRERAIDAAIRAAK